METPLRTTDGTPDAHGDVRIGISSCLMGEEVRYDGGHARDGFLAGTLSRFVTFHAVCPEVEIGMGIPREPIRLAASPEGVRLIEVAGGVDHTRAMKRFAARKAEDLARLGLHGYIFKQSSPSCGLFGVKVHRDGSAVRREGRGLFAAAVVERLPLLPVEEEGRLCDPDLRENFFERVFAYRRLTRLFGRRWTYGGLARFHASETMLLLAHEPMRCRALGRFVAAAKGTSPRRIAREYPRSFMDILSRRATVRRHTSVLRRMAGHLKARVGAAERAEILGRIENYRLGLVPLIVPVTLIRHAARIHGVDSLKGQTYLDPHPMELMLRNHV